MTSTLTQQQLDEIEAWTRSPLGPGVAAEQELFASLVAEVRRLRARVAELEAAPLCGKTWGADGNEYSPCARREGHEEAYCRSADSNDYFLAAVEETHVVADDSDDPEHVDDCPGCAASAVSGAADSRQP